MRCQPLGLYYQLHRCKSSVLFAHPGCHEGDIRLIEGSTSLEGRVEICKHNVWGTVCDNSWNTPDARIVCRQLGWSVAGQRCLGVH